jgi:hypothetical protein
VPVTAGHIQQLRKSRCDPLDTNLDLLLRLVDALPTTVAALSSDRATALALDLGA